MDKRYTEPLKERGIRVTAQRAYIWRALVGSGKHFTVKELREHVGETLPGLEVSTVYRTLEAFNEAGLTSREQGARRSSGFRGQPEPASTPRLRRLRQHFSPRNSRQPADAGVPEPRRSGLRGAKHARVRDRAVRGLRPGRLEPVVFRAVSRYAVSRYAVSRYAESLARARSRP